MSGASASQVTVVVAAYNEAQSLPLLHPRVMAALDALKGVQGHVLYVDDGSRDATWTVMRTLAANDPRVSVLRLSRNFGKEAALTAGLDRVETEESRNAHWQRLGWWFTIVALPAAAIGCAVLARRQPLVLTPLISVVVATAFSYGNQRLRLVADPVLLTGVAITFVALLRRVSFLRPRLSP